MLIKLQSDVHIRHIFVFNKKGRNSWLITIFDLRKPRVVFDTSTPVYKFDSKQKYSVK